MNYKIILAFLGMCFAWGFSWFAVKIQLNSAVNLEVSLFYRFILVSILMFVICFFSKIKLSLKKAELPYFIIIAMANFSFNFLLVYYAIKLIPSGIVAVIFSLSIICAEILSSFFARRKLSKRVLATSLIGTIGLSIFVYPLIYLQKSNYLQNIHGLILSFLAMIIYSIGGVMVAQNKLINQTPLFKLISYCSAIGALIMLVINVIKFSFFHSQGNITFLDYGFFYSLSLFYLVAIGTILAFICLFYLVQKIGSAKANYTALIYPIIALTTSAYFENYKFNFLAIIGLVLIICAIFIEFSFKKTLK